MTVISLGVIKVYINTGRVKPRYFETPLQDFESYNMII